MSKEAYICQKKHIKEAYKGSPFAPKERLNGDRTVGRSHKVIDCLALGEGPVGRAVKQSEADLEAALDCTLREAEEEIGQPPPSKL